MQVGRYIGQSRYGRGHRYICRLIGALNRVEIVEDIDTYVGWLNVDRCIEQVDGLDNKDTYVCWQIDRIVLPVSSHIPNNTHYLQTSQCLVTQNDVAEAM